MRLCVLIAVVVAVLATSAAFCADPNAPSWRGTAGTTYQEWVFNTAVNPAAPESVSNPFGMPSATMDYDPRFAYGWYNSVPAVYGSAQGWWSVSRGSIALSIISRPGISVDISQDFQIQFDYWDDINKVPSVVLSPSATLVSKTTTLVESGPAGGEWYRDVWTLHVDPNQNSETITIQGHPTMGSQIDRIVVDTRYTAVPSSAAQARALPDGTVCELNGPVVTRSFGSFFYLEDRNRVAGIRVDCASGQTAGAEGTAPKVSGILRVIDGERVIDQASVEPGGTGTVLALGMCNRAVMSGLSPQGLLVRLWGRARVASPGGSVFVLDDGSPQGVTVELHGATAPADGSYVAVTGVLGADSAGPVLRVGPGDAIGKMD